MPARHDAASAALKITGHASFDMIGLLAEKLDVIAVLCSSQENCCFGGCAARRRRSRDEAPVPMTQQGESCSVDRTSNMTTSRDEQRDRIKSQSPLTIPPASSS